MSRSRVVVNRTFVFFVKLITILIDHKNEHVSFMTNKTIRLLHFGILFCEHLFTPSKFMILSIFIFVSAFEWLEGYQCIPYIGCQGGQGSMYKASLKSFQHTSCQFALMMLPGIFWNLVFEELKCSVFNVMTLCNSLQFQCLVLGSVINPSLCSPLNSTLSNVRNILACIW